MAQHLVLGAGGIGRSTAAALVAAGEEVTVVSRSGTDPGADGAQALALDVTDTTRLVAALEGAATVVNALNPTAYTAWERDWPPMATAILDAAERSGARLVTVSNLYLYGRVDAPMTEATPVRPNGAKGTVRARMWADALARHDAGRVRASEVRASDYVGPRTVASSMLSGMVIKALVADRTAWAPMGGPDVPHSWTYDADVAALVTRLALSSDDADFGRPWHVPTAPPATMAEVHEVVRELVGGRAGRLRFVPPWVVSVGGLAVPILRELKETRHQFDRPFVLDSSAAQSRFGLAPTPLRDALAATVDELRRTA